jgi:hypothetical protein
MAVSLPNRLDNNPLAVLVPRQATITAMCFDVTSSNARQRRPRHGDETSEVPDR